MSRCRLTTILLMLATWIALPATAWSSSGHGQAEESSAVVFRTAAAQVELRLEPPFFSAAATPRVMVRLTRPATGQPVLDAEVYLRLTPARQPGSSQVTPSPSRSTTAASSPLATGLDLDTPPQTTTVFDPADFVRLRPSQRAGVFGVAYPLPHPGTYAFTLALRAVDGQAFPEPLIYGADIRYPPKNRAQEYRLLWVLSLLFLSGLTSLWLMRQRQAASLEPGRSLNLLELPWFSRLVKSAWFQPLFQIPTFLVFTVVILAGLFDVQAGDRNIATILTWTIWWAGIIFSFVLLGRIWCMMCPFGAAQDLIGRRFGLDKGFPKPLRNIWLSTFLFLGLTWWDSYSGIVNRPALTAWLLIGFLVVSIVTALVYKGRAFCRYLCPIGGLIGLYSMFSPLELRRRSPAVCRTDRQKGCIRGTATSHGCPMFSPPMTMDRNNYCNLCGECVKSCQPRNLVLRFRGFARDLWASSRGSMDEAYLSLVLVGLTLLMTAEMVAPWHGWLDSLIKTLPLASFGLTTHSGQEKAAFSVLLAIGSLLLPALLLLGASVMVRRLTGRNRAPGTARIFIEFAYMFIPVGLAVHLAHNLSHLLSEGQGVIPATQRLVRLSLGLEMGKPDWHLPPLVGMETLFWLQMGVLLLMNGYALYAGYRIATRLFGDKGFRAYVPMALLALAFMLVNAYVLGQPMSPRHSH